MRYIICVNKDLKPKQFILGVFTCKIVPVWKSYRYESRTGMKVVLVWKSYRYEIMSFQYSYVPGWTRTGMTRTGIKFRSAIM